MTIRRVWRLGFRKDPCNFVPRAHCSWNHRFDDIDRSYRTLYCADNRRTCLREILADLRPNTKALDEFKTLFGPNAQIAPGVVSWSWRRQHTLAEGRIVCTVGDIVHVEAIPIRRTLEREHASLLRRHEMKHLDLSEIRSRHREVTQTISRALYDNGNAGIHFRSQLDNGLCFALFEGRAFMKPGEAQFPMTENVPELTFVAKEFGLVLKNAA